jgi:hypothetical protein
MMGGGMSDLGSILPGVTDGLGNIFSGFMDIGKQIMSLVGIIFSMDWTPIIEPLMAFGVFAIQWLVGIAGLWVEVAGAVIGGILTIFTHLQETGALQALIDAIGGLMGMIIWSFGFIMQAFADSGVTFESVGQFLTDVITGFVDFLISSGILDFMVECMIMLAEVAGVVIAVIAIIIGVVIRLVGFLVPFLTPLWLTFKLVMGIVITIIMHTMRVIITIIRIIVAIFTLDFGKVGELFASLGDIFIDTFSGLWGFIEGWVEGILDFLSPVLDAIETVVDGVGGVIGGVGDFVGGLFATGGVARGPDSGYPAILHGTEAVVPLPDGSSIPVTIKGMGGGGGGDSYTANISVSGGGNAREIAQQVSQEVQRAFRTRSRSGGYGRGVI